MTANKPPAPQINNNALTTILLTLVLGGTGGLVIKFSDKDTEENAKKHIHIAQALGEEMQKDMAELRDEYEDLIDACERVQRKVNHIEEMLETREMKNETKP